MVIFKPAAVVRLEYGGIADRVKAGAVRSDCQCVRFNFRILAPATLCINKAAAGTAIQTTESSAE